MINTIAGKKIYHILVPDIAKVRIERARHRRVMVFLKIFFRVQETYFKKHSNKLKLNSERKKDILRNFALLIEKEYNVFPEVDNQIHDKYFTRRIRVEKDPNTGLFYVFIDDKKLFYKRGMSKSSIIYSFNTVSFEQDYASPHRYLTVDNYFIGVIKPNNMQNEELDSFEVSDGDIVVDAGVAEGNFALSVVEKASKVYIVEGDAKWCEALKQTFLPYKEKVEIIQKNLSNINDKDNITLTELMTQYNINRIDFLKMDIEGYEKQALYGGSLNKEKAVNIAKMAICVYHNPEDEMEISKIVTQQGYKAYLTKGYMVVADYKNPIIRKVILRAHKEN
ncbi:MAG: FkbM family methyltransferase [Nitrososphaerota archaeon]|jgi:hypothetical protein|nr:FkbM family methyltransferase [Nitrososphaerota archaeon]